ncbi:MAG: endonuclease/exonuclease/phosphatase family protein [Sandaracinaceae bacterium]
MRNTPSLTPIHEVQGPDVRSPFAGKTVRIRGVVTGHTRKGYFVQDPDGSPDPRASAAIFVYSPRRKARVGMSVEVVGNVIDFRRHERGRPTTQLKVLETRKLQKDGPTIEPVWLTPDRLPADPVELATVLNGLEGMLVGIVADSTFVAASNPYGDYVCVPPGIDALRATNGGVVVDPASPSRWLPGFRIVKYRDAPKVNVGATLRSPVVGPLNYRAESFQVVARGGIEFDDAPVTQTRTSFDDAPDRITVLTVNGFNLDAHVEDPRAVSDPDRDVDDDKLYGRFELLADAIVGQAGSPDVIALQEIQDNDGAEITEVVDATATYEQLANDIRWRGGPDYHWADIPPDVGADGGQPGGNIRNAFLYNPARVELVEASLRRLGTSDVAYEGSRKPLLACFRVRASGAELVVVNVHLASKRHQNSIFAPDQPGYDPREPTRVRQAEIVREALSDLRARGGDFYVTGDFNDFEFSATLRALTGDDCVNMVETLPPEDRYDYNHRGQLQVLMHGVVPKRAHDAGAVEYQILHGNELAGVKPGSTYAKASDHAYVIARIRVGDGLARGA